MRRALNTYKRGDILKGVVYEEVINNRSTSMYVEITLNLKDQEPVITRIPIPERDQDLAEYKLSEAMREQFYKLHGKSTK